MKNVLRALLLVPLLFACLAVGAPADSLPVSVADAWIQVARRDGPYAPNAYVTLTNGGDATAVLVRVDTAAAKSVALQMAVATDGGTTVRGVPTIAVAPHTTLPMSAETYFFTLAGLQRDLVEGETVPATLRFADGSGLAVLFQVHAPTADPGQ